MDHSELHEALINAPLCPGRMSPCCGSVGLNKGMRHFARDVCPLVVVLWASNKYGGADLIDLTIQSVRYHMAWGPLIGLTEQLNPIGVGRGLKSGGRNT